MYKIGFISLGCPKNLTDTESMIGLLSGQYEIVNDPMQADIIIVNTCGFIESAKQESIDTVLEMAQYKKRGRLKKLIVTGCLAQRYHEELLKEIPEADAVVGTGSYQNILDAVTNVLKGETAQLLDDINGEIPEDLPRTLSTPSYTAYLKIADGCDNHCTYCIIPFLRGRYRSRRMEKILEEARSLADRGVSELIVIAQDTTGYGTDLYEEQKLPQLLEKLSEIEGIHWIRLHYCYPERVTDKLIKAMAENPKVCRYIDIPMQHASDKILKRMGRHVTKENLVRLVQKLRKAMPDITIRTTFITGFSGETEEDFAELYDFVKEMKFERMGVFPFSLEEGTPAEKLDGVVEEETKKKRADKLLELQQNISLENNRRKIGEMVMTLCEGQLRDGRYVGRTVGDSPDIDGKVVFEGDNIKTGQYVNVLITEASEYDLEGKIPENFEEEDL
ncbi:MAG: 30S ribosomal protein S12 methylthiotransferase RimO [Bacillota bacterium]|nr:30S ribosomal protein S12 methylthiotransferase RimO [Bacillota bacterium]